MRRATICGAIMALALTAADAASNQYVCITESVGGLHYDAGTRLWKAQGLTQGLTPSGKYILRRINEDDMRIWGNRLPETHGSDVDNDTTQERRQFKVGDWAFVTFGQDPNLLALCLAGFREGFPYACKPYAATLAPVSDFGTDARRFEMVYRGAYIKQGERLRGERLPGLVSDPSHPADLFIEIGECGPF
jgi:hypothetical protein